MSLLTIRLGLQGARRAKTYWTIGVVVCLALVSGCDKGVKHYRVTGNVTFDGKPLPEGEIVFFPADGSGQPDAGLIKDGKFDFPAVAGQMRVEISAERDHPTKKIPGGTKGTWVPAKENYIPDRYNVESELLVEVTHGGDNTFDFPLTDRHLNQP